MLNEAGFVGTGVPPLRETFQRACRFAVIRRIERAVNVLKDDAGLVIAALVDIWALIEVTGIQPAKPFVIRQHLCVAGAQGGLIKEIASPFLAQIVAVELRGRVGDRLSNHGVVEAMKDINLLMAEIACRADFS